MTTTAFQWIFDNAASISINKRAITAQTISRDQTVRTVSRGGQVWRFNINLPGGLPWTQARPYIEAIDVADRFTQGTVQINNTGYNKWLMPYQGNSVNTTGFTANVTQSYPNVTLSSSPTTTSGYKFRAGDLLQLGSAGRVYSVASDVAFNSNLVALNRPVLDSTASNVSVIVGPAVTWTVICLTIPDWTISDRNVVSFGGPFEFIEAIV